MPDDTASMLQPLRRQVTASPGEFRRGLHLAFPGRVTEQVEVFRIDGDAAVMEISFKVGPPRIIALLNLPTLDVSIRFISGSPEAQQALLAHMDRAMHRGGG
jgi:hypothetical protein